MAANVVVHKLCITNGRVEEKYRAAFGTRPARAQEWETRSAVTASIPDSRKLEHISIRLRQDMARKHVNREQTAFIWRV